MRASRANGMSVAHAYTATPIRLSTATIATTEARNSSTMTTVARRARCCCSKKSMARAFRAGRSGERDLHRLALLGRLGRLEQRGGEEAAEARDQVVRKAL